MEGFYSVESAPAVETEGYTKYGRPKTHLTTKPTGTTTYFTGRDDAESAPSIGEGNNEIIFNMADTDTQKYRDLVFCQDIMLKEGEVRFEGAPLGASFSVSILDPTKSVMVHRFVNRLPILGSGRQPVETEDFSEVPSGYVIRVSCFNSDPTKTDHEAKSAFKMSGHLEMFVQKTIGAP